MVRAASLMFLIGCGSVNAAHDAGGLADAAPADAAATGLVAWYTMDAPALTTVTDASGHHHDGLCGGNSGAECPLVSGSPRSGAYVFNGTTDMIRVHPDPELNGSAGFTVAVWINRGAATSGCVVNKGFGTAEDNSWQACMNGNGDVAFFSTGSGDGAAQTTSGHSLPVGEWHHVALWSNGMTKATYIDGERTAMNDFITSFDSDDITIGADVDDGAIATPFTGMLDDVRIYNRALSDTEITALQSL